MNHKNDEEEERNKEEEEEAFVAGYTDKLSGRPGEDSIRFYVSCHSEQDYEARLFRSVCADPNPAGPGIVEHDASQYFASTKFPSRRQPFSRGSYAESENSIGISSCRKKAGGVGLQRQQQQLDSVTLSIWLYPMCIPYRKRQYIMSWGPIYMVLNTSGQLEMEFDTNNNGGGGGGGDSNESNSSNKVAKDEKKNVCCLCSSSKNLDPYRWYHCCLMINDNNTALLTAYTDDKNAVEREIRTTTTEQESADSSSISLLLWKSVLAVDAPILLARGGTLNGKLEDPKLMINGNTVIASWNFGTDDMSSFSVPPGVAGGAGGGNNNINKDSLLQGGNLLLRRSPTRAVKGRSWDGSEFSWKHKLEHYGAIRFHDDDVYDFEWDCDFVWKLPADIPSAAYVMRLTTAEGHYDALPVFVLPPRQPSKEQQQQQQQQQTTCSTSTKNRICLVVPTFTYVVYGNHARDDFEPAWFDRIRGNPHAYPNHPNVFRQYGLSTYNYHSDGRSGIGYASHKRPLFNVRPGYITFPASGCSGLRHFPADSHLIAWFDRQSDMRDVVDIVTDHDVHREGCSLLEPYKVVVTGSHPEYHTAETLNALERYRDECAGRIAYLGGNGFYWRIACHPADQSLLELRRSEAGIRAWEAEPGEYYHAFDGGGYGGLWRRIGRPPQRLVGIGFAAQGNFTAAVPYQRVCFDPDMDWVFEGMDDDDTAVLLGDFGLSGGGAAGFELDRVDRRLDGGLAQLTILAQSTTRPQQQQEQEGQSDCVGGSSSSSSSHFMLVPEEILTHLRNVSGETEPKTKRADMVYVQTATGGQVFSVGSITFCGSLPWNDFDNNISTLLGNVMRKFLAD